jgi:undecaprenyl diphosphate synthase
VLTIFAFSEENWQRPATEIAALMELLREFITREGERLRKEGVVVRVFGDLDRLTPPARAAVDEVQRDTAGGQNLALNVCLSYSSRAEITRAARLLAEDVQRGALRPDQIDEPALAGRLYTAGVPDPDLLIRTSGEQRVSNFLLWQLAYTEIYITPVLWPDFSRQTLWEAILDYQRRERRFGKVPVA